MMKLDECNNCNVIGVALVRFDTMMVCQKCYNELNDKYGLPFAIWMQESLLKHTAKEDKKNATK